MEQIYNFLIFFGMALLIIGVITGFMGFGFTAGFTGIAGFTLTLISIWGIYDWTINHKERI